MLRSVSVVTTCGRRRDSSIAAGVSSAGSSLVRLQLALGESVEDLFFVTRFAAPSICLASFSSEKIP